MAITEERPTAGECPRTTSLQRIHKRPAYTPGHSQLCVCRRPCCHYTEHGLCTDRGNTDLGSRRSVGVLYHLRANPTKTQVRLFHLRNRECGKQLNISWNGVNLTHCNLPVYLGATLDQTLSYKAHIEKTKKKVGTRNIIRKLRTSKWGATPTTLRSSALVLCYSAAEYACPVWERYTHAKKLDATQNENLSNDHRLSEADKYQQSARTRQNRPIRHQETDGKSYGTDSTNYGPKAPTQWTSRSGAMPEITEELHQMH